MMAASLHTLLSKLGLVLGISGFFHSTVGSTLSSFSSSKGGSAGSASKTSTIFSVVAPYFTAGIFVGGAVLGLARSRIETGLGIPILDATGTSGHAPFLSVAALGALVGLGTKVSRVRALP